MKFTNLPIEQVEKYFYKYSSNVTKGSNGILNGKCPVCREGSSWSTKKRLYFIPEKHLITCHNCATNWNDLNWIKIVSGLTYKEIFNDSLNYDLYCDEPIEQPKKKNNQILPHDSINLFDPIQIKYYEDNEVVQDALNLIKNRRLDTAINKCTLYISLKDFIHKNRLCIPFYESNNRINFFQTRAIYKEDEDIAKYLSKSNCDKTIFGLNNIDTHLEYLFITEGPIDSMFVQRNGISLAGLQISEKQKELLTPYFLYNKIWILDNQLENKEVFEKNMKLIESGETIFIWPKKFKGIKDFNELCCKLKLNKINTEFILKHSHSGLKAKILLTTL